MSLLTSLLIWTIPLTAAPDIGAYQYASAAVPTLSINGHQDEIVIQDNHTYSTTSSGIAVWKSQNIIVEGNEIEKPNVSLPQENMSIGENVTQFEIRYNHIHRNKEIVLLD